MKKTTNVLDCPRCSLGMQLVNIDGWYFQARTFCVACQRGHIVKVRRVEFDDNGNAIGVTVRDRNEDGNIVGTTTILLPED